MSMEPSDVIDIINANRLTGEVILTISDHLDWPGAGAHQLLPQNKLSRCLAFDESGEILESYPAAKGRPVVFSLVFKYPPDEGCRAFLAKVRPIIESAGFGLQECVSSGALVN